MCQVAISLTKLRYKILKSSYHWGLIYYVKYINITVSEQLQCNSLYVYTYVQHSTFFIFMYASIVTEFDKMESFTDNLYFTI